jgi:hypothetical protein
MGTIHRSSKSAEFSGHSIEIWILETAFPGMELYEPKSKNFTIISKTSSLQCLANSTKNTYPKTQMRIQAKYPTQNWKQIWENVSTKYLPQEVTTTMHRLVHGGARHCTNERTNNDPRTSAPAARQHTLLHRFTAC